MSDLYDKVRKDEKKKKPRRDFSKWIGVALILVFLLIMIALTLFVLPLLAVNRFNL